jgi:predicted kinase
LNVLVYKYYDARGACHVSAKPRVQPFLTGSALAFVQQLLIEPPAKTLSLTSLPLLLARLANKKIQSMSFELCGSEVPHLVRYEFPLLLKPLFCTTMDGKIYPMASAEDKELVLTGQFDPKLSRLCLQRRQEDLERNELFRAQRSLRKCHWIGHFATEGSVLYLLDKNGGLAHREGFMLKIKPSDIEAVHAVQIDQDVQQLLLEQIAPRLLPQVPPPSATELRQLLGLPHGAWELHCRDIFALMHWRLQHPEAALPAPPHLLSPLPLPYPPTSATKKPAATAAAPEQPEWPLLKGRPPLRMLVLVGMPGSGKSTLAKRLLEHGWSRINQDELGSRRACELATEEELRNGRSVVVDRCNFDAKQRQTWLDLARKYRLPRVDAVCLDVPAETCLARITVREDHPTIAAGDAATSANIIANFQRQLVWPKRSEGFEEVVVARTSAEIDALLTRFCLIHRH